VPLKLFQHSQQPAVAFAGWPTPRARLSIIDLAMANWACRPSLKKDLATSFVIITEFNRKTQGFW